MADFRPFKGLVPSLSKRESIGDRISPPYDVIDEDQREALQSSPRNITRITLGARKGRYGAVAKELDSWIGAGALVEDEDDCFYVYHQTFNENGTDLTRTGIVGKLRVEPYGKSVLPHEETSAKVKEDRLNLLRAIETHPESIFCLYERSDATTERMLDEAEPLFEYLDGSGVRHSFARLNDPKAIKAVTRLISGQQLLIADGHHRYETALRYSQENPEDKRKAFVLATLVATDDPGLVVRPTHRLYEVGGFSTDFFLSLAAKEFLLWEAKDLEELQKFMSGSKRTALGFISKDGRMFLGESLAIPSKDPLDSLDAKICEEAVFARMLKPLAEGREVTVEFDHDLRSVYDKMASGEWDVAVILSPPKLDMVWKVAKLGKKMPRKSTFFWPKIWSGFVLYPMK